MFYDLFGAAQALQSPRLAFIDSNGPLRHPMRNFIDAERVEDGNKLYVLGY